MASSFFSPMVPAGGMAGPFSCAEDEKIHWDRWLAGDSEVTRRAFRGRGEIVRLKPELLRGLLGRRTMLVLRCDGGFPFAERKVTIEWGLPMHLQRIGQRPLRQKVAIF